MKGYLFGFAIALTFAGITTTHASGIVSDKLGTIQPYTGEYYDPNQSGSGLAVDIGPGGLMFLQFATYDANGNQVNYITQPTWVPSSESTRLATHVIGTATGKMYQVTGGQCPGCPYTGFPTVTVVPIVPTFAWTSPRHVSMSFDGHTYNLGAQNYEGKDDEEFLPGTWALSFLNDNSVYAGQGPEYQNTLPTELAVMRIASAPFTVAQLTLDPASSADVQLPPSDAHLYTLQCVGNQMGTDDAACNSTELIWTNAIPGSRRNPIPRGTAKAMLWYDPASATGGMDIYQINASGAPVVGPANFHGEVYITPNSLQVHLLGQGPPGVAAVTDGIDAIALTFTRLPATTVRDCYDYPSSSQCQ
ncbi:MAG: hypothetical protein ABI304_11590 [Rudaea sp.]